MKTIPNDSFTAEWTASRGEFLKSFAALQYELPPLTKNHTATIRIREDKGGGSYHYKYADLTDTWEVVRPLLKKHGLVLIQLTEPFNDSGDTVISTHLFEIKSGEGFVSYLCVGHNVSAPDEGAKLTYMRRYAIHCVLGISTEDPDADLEAQALSALQQTRDKFHPLIVDALGTEIDDEVKRVIDQMDQWQYNVIWQDLNSKQKATCRDMLYRARVASGDISKSSDEPTAVYESKTRQRMAAKNGKRGSKKRVTKKASRGKS